MSYSARDYAEMHFYYGVAAGNARLAARLYREQVQRRGGPQPETYPDYRVILRTHNAYIEGRIPGSRGHRENHQDFERTDVVVEAVQTDPTTSIRTIARQTGISRSSIQRTLKVKMFHSYHVQKVQELRPADYSKRLVFCREMLRRNEESEHFFESILWTDESHFKRSGIFNMHNYHHWSIENPRLVRASNFQTQFGVNLWGGIINGQLIGPFELPERLNGNSYLDFLRNDLPGLLEDVICTVRR